MANIKKGNYQAQLTKKLEELEKWKAEATNYESHGREFLVELEQDENLAKFKQEYEKVLRILLRSKATSSKLKTKYEDAIHELDTADQTMIDTTKLSHDATTLKTLRNQIVRAENMLVASNKREELAKLDLRQLKQDITSLNTTIKQGVGLSAAQERTINELIASKEQCTKDLENELEMIVTLRNGLTTISEKIDSMEIERKHIDREIQLLKDKNASKKIEIDMEMRNKDKLERELRELRVVVTIKSQEAVGKQGTVNKATEDIATIEAQIKNQKNMIEKLLRDQESLGTRTIKLQQDYDDQMVLTKQLQAENEISLEELKVKERELSNHCHEVKKVNRIKDALVKKSRALEDQKLSAENERKIHRAQNDAYLVEINKLKRRLEGVKKTIDDLNREKDLLGSSLKKSGTESGRLQSLILLQRQQQATIELEIARFDREVAENQKEMKTLRSLRDRYVGELETLTNQINSGKTELKEKEFKIFEYKRQTLQAENKLKYQQNLYEAVQSDRKLHAKQLVDSQGQIAEMRRKLKIMNFQINGFKDDVNAKDSSLLKETSEISKLKKDSELINEEIKTLKGQNELAAAYIKTQMVEEYKLDQFVKEAEVERARQQAALDLIVTERDNLTSKLLQRNHELTTVYDKIKIQSLEMLRGEIHYNEKLKVITELRREILTHKVEVGNLSLETAQIPSIEKHIIRLENQIIDSQTRIKALEEELDNPINVHRWRKLEGSHPQAYEMLLLLHTLQKKLITKTKEEAEKSKVIEIKEKWYLHLKTLLAKQAGPEATQQIAEFRKILKEKAAQFRHMDTELLMYQAQVQEYQYSIQQLDTGLTDCKQQFIKLYHQNSNQQPV